MWRGVTEAEPFLTGRSMVIATDHRSVGFLAYPISARAAARGRSLVNWVAQVSLADPQPLAEDVDWNRTGRAADVLPHYADWALGWLDVPGLIAGSAEVLEYPMVDRDPLPTWGTGPITLLGDAAHPMYPVGANGASQAIVDARVLAHGLAACAEPIRALAAYETTRRDATTAVVLANREMARADHTATRRDEGDQAAAAIAAITDTYRRATGSDVDTLNDRASLTPDRR